MFHLASSRGRGPALPDLPPTLHPCVVAGSAPPADHRRAALFTGLIYAALVASAYGVSMLSPTVPVLRQPPSGPVWRPVDITTPPMPTLPRVTPPPTHPGMVAPTSPSPAAPTAQAPPELPGPLTTHTDPRPAPQPGSGAPAHPGAGAPAGTGTGVQVVSGPVVHDFTATGLAVTHQVPPVYPDLARHARIEGPVLLRIIVDEQGQPTQVEVLKGHAVFHAAARKAAMQWRFAPARMDGRPVPASFQLTLNFKLR